MNAKYSLYPAPKLLMTNRACEIISPLTLDQVMLKDIKDGEAFAAKISHIISVDAIRNTARIETNPVFGNAKDREKIIAELSMNGCTRENAKIAAQELRISEWQIYKLDNKLSHNIDYSDSCAPRLSKFGWAYTITANSTRIS